MGPGVAGAVCADPLTLRLIDEGSGGSDRPVAGGPEVRRVAIAARASDGLVVRYLRADAIGFPQDQREPGELLLRHAACFPRLLHPVGSARGPPGDNGGQFGHPMERLEEPLAKETLAGEAARRVVAGVLPSLAEGASGGVRAGGYRVVHLPDPFLAYCLRSVCRWMRGGASAR